MKEKTFSLANHDNFWYGFFPKLKQLGVKHAISTKLGGTSAIFPATANMSFNVGDDESCVFANRTKMAQAIGANPEHIVATRQVHSTNIICVNHTHQGQGAHSLDTALANTDGFITNTPNLPLLLFFADCVPIIIYDPTKNVLAVLHSGWRGTVNGIAKEAIYKMQQEFSCNPQDCHAFIAPSIGPCCYEVDKTVAEQVFAKFPNHTSLIKETGVGKWHFNLWEANRTNLTTVGVPTENIQISDVCTMENNSLFFSHRKEHGHTGRFAVMAML